jgi:hypothetical protein
MPEGPDDSSNTLAVDNDGDIDVDSNDGVDSILPVLDYESDGGSIGLVSDGSTTPATVYMAGTVNKNSDPIDLNARTPNPNANPRAPPGFNN